MGISVCTSKFFLILLSLVFLAASVGLGYIGISAIVTYKQYKDFLGNAYVMLPSVIILALGVFMFIIAIIGLCSTAQESCCGLGCFITLISIILAAGVAVLVLGLVYKDKIDPELEKNMSILFNKYNGGNFESSTIDFIQEQVQCCGTTNYTSWRNTTWFQANQTVPHSCCRKNATDCTGKIDEPSKIYTEGCEGKVEDVIHKVLGYSMLVILVFAVIEFLCLISLCVIHRRRSTRGYEIL